MAHFIPFLEFDRPAARHPREEKKVDKEMQDMEFPPGFHAWSEEEQVAHRKRFQHYSRLLGLVKPACLPPQEHGKGMQVKGEVKNAFPITDYTRKLKKRFEEHMKEFA